MIDTKALREEILDLAIRGRLVPQDPNDEPASLLLDRIRVQKQQMVKEGKLKAKDIKNDTIIFKGEDNLHYEQFADGSVKCIEDEIPFEVPKGWGWERLSNLASFSGGKTPSKSNREYWEGDIIWVTSKDMKSKYIDSSLLMMSEKGLEQMQLYPENTLLLVTRSGILRHTIPVAILKKPATINQDLKAIMPYIPNLEEYIYICIKGMESRLILEYTKAGATVENINFDAFQKILLPIPPENQIQRIIIATNEAEEVIGKLKINQEDLIDIIGEAKSKILDLAIRGKLVPQDPNDEPASILLEHIRAEKEELIKQGKIKRDKKESVIFKGEDNSYYQDLPENWELCSILNIAEVELGKTLDKKKNTGKFYPYLRSINVKWNDIDLSDLNQMRFEPEEIERYTVHKNDLLICEGGDVGRCCVWQGEPILYQNALHRVRFYGSCNPYFFVYTLMWLEKIGYLKRISNGVTIKHLTKSILGTIQFPLPPLAEQNQIVKAIEIAFTYLDKIMNYIS